MEMDAAPATILETESVLLWHEIVDNKPDCKYAQAKLRPAQSVKEATAEENKTRDAVSPEVEVTQMEFEP